MKKIISILLCAVMMVSMMTVLASAHGDNLKLGVIPVSTTTPQIDGVKGTEYDRSLRIAIDAPLGAIYNPSTEDGGYATGIAYLMLSPDYSKLYVYVIVTDNDMVFDITPTDATLTEDVTPASAWMHDGVEIFIDPTNNGFVEITTDEDGYPQYNSEQRNTNLYQFRTELVDGTKTSWANGASTETALNSIFESARKVVDGVTYTVEFAVDLSAISQMSGVDICKKDAQMGFQLMINDQVRNTEQLFNTMSSIGDGKCTLNYYGTNANSPSVWAAQDWNYVILGTTETQDNGVIDKYEGKDTTQDGTEAAKNHAGATDSKNGSTSGTGTGTGSGSTATKTADTLAVSAAVLLLAAAGAVVATKKRR